MWNMRNADYAVANEVERFIREIGQVTDDDADFTRQVHLHHSGYLDSHGVVQLITYLEEKFQIKLTNEKISDPAFVTIDGISAIVTAMLQERLAGTAP
jgi:acyl carrier protein